MNQVSAIRKARGMVVRRAGPTGDVLIERAAGRDIEDLEPAANPQHGHLPVQACTREMDLEEISFRIRFLTALVARCSVIGRGNIFSAGEQ